MSNALELQQQKKGRCVLVTSTGWTICLDNPITCLVFFFICGLIPSVVRSSVIYWSMVPLNQEILRFVCHESGCQNERSLSHCEVSLTYRSVTTICSILRRSREYSIDEKCKGRFKGILEALRDSRKGDESAIYFARRIDRSTPPQGQRFTKSVTLDSIHPLSQSKHDSIRIWTERTARFCPSLWFLTRFRPSPSILCWQTDQLFSFESIRDCAVTKMQPPRSQMIWDVGLRVEGWLILWRTVLEAVNPPLTWANFSGLAFTITLIQRSPRQFFHTLQCSKPSR